MNAGAIDGAAEYLFEMNEPMPVVEVQAAEHLVGPISKLCREELARGRGRIHRGAGTQRFAVVTARELEGRHEAGITRGAQAAKGEQALGFGGEQAAQAAAKVLQELPRRVEGIAAAGSGAQNDGQELGIGQCVGAALDKAFSRALTARPLADANLLIHSAILPFRRGRAEASNDARIANNCRNYWPNQCDW
jgi:hypothetical protein